MSTRLFCRAHLASSEMQSSLSIVWFGSNRPRLTPASGSFGPASIPSMRLIPGQTPPESCQPPPEPPSHSPRIARAVINRWSISSNPPSSAEIWPVARISTAIKLPSRFVETASLEPFGISLTLLTSSSPKPSRPMSVASSWDIF